MHNPSSFPRQAILVVSNFCRTLTPVRLVLPVLLGGAGLVFLKLVSELLEGEDLPLDRSILLALRHKSDLALPIGPGWLTHAMDDITSIGGITVLGLMTVLVTLYLLLARRRIAALTVLFSVASGWLLSNILKIGIARPRPDIVPHLIEVHDLSFPSGYAMVSAVTYLTLGLLLSEVQKTRALKIYVLAVATLLTIMIGFSRIYLGVHYPSDVLGGWCAGAVWAAMCWLVSRRFIAKEDGAKRD
ncbi:phosphatase PAP2 family protein [Neorhizobium alkalisoli]|uniref:Undecaprenyl-diphosphatase n=1 Tax=Neorhizobium alkalisoli TaxID=528178 RepID=A0A561QX07_9HYPH|nr:phosphatase PAP2 family protein [Neorhizobium alkalisoli]TWF54872.1 undecaprenyl-diphosphatase [Neorhizobium alkalisoli]